MPRAPEAVPRSVTVQALRERVRGEGEWALVDVSEAGQFVMGHVFHAVNAPWSRLEPDIRRLVPRLDTELYLMDQGDGVAGRAARRLRTLGYGRVAVVGGGLPAWREAGLEIFEGEFVPSKAFGEFVEHHFHTPSITPQDLQRWQQERAGTFVVVDPRTLQEHIDGHVPGAVFCAGGELVYRLPSLAPSAGTTVVVACGGRTRAIIGAQALINAGVPNPVVALEGGNLGWRLAGLPLEAGLQRALPCAPAEPEAVRQQAQALAASYRVPTADAAQLTRWQNEAGRTTYVLDVRTEDEYSAGHWPGAVHAPGGQLVQSTDRWLGTWGARVVLVDDDGVRATVTAHWLRQMGWDVHALTLGADALTSQERPADEAPPDAHGLIDAVAAQALLQGGALGLHVGRSLDHILRHPGGVHWVSRVHLNNAAATAAEVVLFSEEPAQAGWARQDLLEAGVPSVHVVRGGVAAWAQAGLPLVQGDVALRPGQRIDTLYWNHERKGENLDHMRAYLDWEVALPAQVAAEGFVRFRLGATEQSAALREGVPLLA